MAALAYGYLTRDMSHLRPRDGDTVYLREHICRALTNASEGVVCTDNVLTPR